MATALQIIRKFYPEVESVRDSKRNITIEVTKADANAKSVKNHKECAMAMACKRNGADAAIIAVKYSYIIKDNKAVRYCNPESVSREITSFDRNAGFEPGVYHLAKVPPSCELGIKRAYTKARSGSQKMEYHRTENVRVSPNS